jgi:hypothetical protein
MTMAKNLGREKALSFPTPAYNRDSVVLSLEAKEIVAQE